MSYETTTSKIPHRETDIPFCLISFIIFLNLFPPLRLFTPTEKEYDAHLAKVRSYLARPATMTSTSNANDVTSCEASLRDARKCANAMLALAEVDGDPFRMADSRNRISRDVMPLEEEIKLRRRGGGGGGARGGRGGGGRGNLLGGGAVSSSSYAPPSIGTDGDDDVESSRMSILDDDGGTVLESERLLREAQSLCAESEQIGNMTLENMGRQREQIVRAGGLIETSIENTRMASQIMREM